MNEMDAVDERGCVDCKQETGEATATDIDQDLAEELAADYKEWNRRDAMSMIPLTVFSVVFLAVSICCLLAVCSWSH